MSTPQSGGSYVRREDGSLDRVEYTRPLDEPGPTTPTPKPARDAGKPAKEPR